MRLNLAFSLELESFKNGKVNFLANFGESIKSSGSSKHLFNNHDAFSKKVSQPPVKSSFSDSQ